VDQGATRATGLGPRTKRVSTVVELRSPYLAVFKARWPTGEDKPPCSPCRCKAPMISSVKRATGLNIFVMLPVNILSPKLLVAHGYNYKQISSPKNLYPRAILLVRAWSGSLWTGALRHRFYCSCTRPGMHPVQRCPKCTSQLHHPCVCVSRTSCDAVDRVQIPLNMRKCHQTLVLQHVVYMLLHELHMLICLYVQAGVWI
jgi:hypothetical protein